MRINRNWDAAITVALVVSAWLLYLPLTSFTVQESDGGEFATAAALGAIVHPPGYPLQMLIATVLVKVLDFPPFQTLSGLSAVLQGIAVGLLFVIARALFVSTPLALATAAAWMLFQPVVRMAVDAEVFALHNVLICLLVLAVIRCAHGGRRFSNYFVIGILAGLGGANHQTIVLWAPVVLAVTFVGGFESGAFIKRGAALLSGAALGLTPYLTLLFPLWQQGSVVYPPFEDFAGFLRHIFRFQYGTFSLTAQTQAWDRSYLPHFILLTFSAIPLFLAAFPVAAIRVLIKKSALEFGIFLSVALHLLFASKLVFHGEVAIFGEFAMRFYGFIALALAIGFSATIASITRRVGESGVIAIALLCPILLRAPHALENANARWDRTVDYELEAILEELPDRGVFIPAPDRVGMGLYYKQLVETKRPDVGLIVEGLLNRRGYLKLLRERYPFLSELDYSKPLELKAIAEATIKDGRRIFAYQETPVPEGFTSYPVGVTWQWIPNDTKISESQVAERMLAFCARWPEKLGQLSPTRRHSWFLIRHLFLRPVWEVGNRLGEGEVRNTLLDAVERFGTPGGAEAQAKCLAELEKLTGNKIPQSNLY